MSSFNPNFSLAPGGSKSDYLDVNTDDDDMGTSGAFLSRMEPTSEPEGGSAYAVVGADSSLYSTPSAGFYDWATPMPYAVVPVGTAGNLFPAGQYYEQPVPGRGAYYATAGGASANAGNANGASGVDALYSKPHKGPRARGAGHTVMVAGLPGATSEESIDSEMPAAMSLYAVPLVDGGDNGFRSDGPMYALASSPAGGHGYETAFTHNPAYGPAASTHMPEYALASCASASAHEYEAALTRNPDYTSTTVYDFPNAGSSVEEDFVTYDTPTLVDPSTIAEHRV
jgi:hypothetical protein